MTRETNQRAIAEGRVDIDQASVSELPFPDAIFDLVTAVETHYYWPDLAHDKAGYARLARAREGRCSAVKRSDFCSDLRKQRMVVESCH